VRVSPWMRNVGHGVPPRLGGRVSASKEGFAAVEEVLFDVAHNRFHAPFFVRFPGPGRPPAQSRNGGEVQVTRMEASGSAQGMFEHPDLEVVDHDLGGEPPKNSKRGDGRKGTAPCLRRG